MRKRTVPGNQTTDDESIKKITTIILLVPIQNG